MKKDLQTVEKSGMMQAEAKTLTADNIRAINAVLAKDQRVELIPTRDGVKVIHVQRREIKGDTAARR